MTKEITIALVIAGALAIVAGVILWTTDEPTQPPVTIPAIFEQTLDSFDEGQDDEDEDEDEDEDGYYKIPIEKDITRIIIVDDSQGGGDDIQEILLEKVIIDEEVKAIKGVNPSEK
ncbi:MAG: hypothetical protein QS721_13255 [Candidatus Endonucleobacter sp. (ex Gigantidas childressi)]|nr:hypothetical protein [Candidatus Endonucleobacter sp. (ex Gigantidas childressi)]